MVQKSFSLTVHKNTTSAEIASFLQRAGSEVGRPDAGLRARPGVGVDGERDGTVVLYVRTLSGAKKTLGDRIASFVDDVKAFFNAKKEYKLAAVTLLERARLASCHELECEDGTKLCPMLAKVSEGKGERLTIQNTRHAWRAAFTEEARIQSNVVLAALRKDVADLKGLPETKQKNGQAPGQVIEKGLSELFYLDALLSVSFHDLGHFEKQHLIALFHHLGQPVTDESLFDLKNSITSLIHVACAHKEAHRIPLASLATNSATDVEHLKTATAFAQTWISGWAARPERDDFLKYDHILAIDYLACMLLTTYQPDSEDSGHPQQLLTKIAKKEPGDNYRSVWVALDAKFVDWLRLGKPAHEYFIDQLTNMSMSASN